MNDGREDGSEGKVTDGLGKKAVIEEMKEVTQREGRIHSRDGGGKKE